MEGFRFSLALVLAGLAGCGQPQKKAIFVILDGIPADVIEKVETPSLDEVAAQGGYTRAMIGGEKGSYSQSPTVSAVGYNHVLTGTWSNKHNVWDNDIAAPNYHYWNMFRIMEAKYPQKTSAIFSTWTDNRTKLAGDGKAESGNVTIDFAFDGYELDTIGYPHTKDRLFISRIDDVVAREASRTILEKGPDLSWVYLEFTDDMGHMYGDSPQFYEAVARADSQVGIIWRAIRQREKSSREKWMIVITTDHGRQASDGKSHGGQSDRERTVWIVTNQKDVNAQFKAPATVDILPSIMRFLDIEVPQPLAGELDGVPFLGRVSIANLKAARTEKRLSITWNALDPEGIATILLATTNNFKTGGKDDYREIGKVPVKEGKFTSGVVPDSKFCKILVHGPHNSINVWVTEQ